MSPGLGYTLCNVIVLGNDAMMRKADGVGVIPVKCDGSKMSGMCAEVVGKVGNGDGKVKSD